MTSVQDHSSDHSSSGEITLYDLCKTIWDGKFLIVAITGLFTLLAVGYALTTTEWYRAEVLVAPAEDKSMGGIVGQLGGLAALAGVRPGGGNTAKTEAIAVLSSRTFATDFINDLELAPVLLDGGEPGDEPIDIRDAVRFFHDNVLRVSENRDTGLVTVAVEWKDAEIAAEWANVLVSRLNRRMRAKALKAAEVNIEYLQSEMASNKLAVLEQSLGRVLENEMQNLLLARGNSEFSFRVIDEAQIPRIRSRPRRSLIVVGAFVIGGTLSLFIIFARNAIRRAP